MVTSGRPVASERAALSPDASLEAWIGSDGSLEPVSRRGQIVSALREAIVRGDIPPGTQLKQDELSVHFRSSPAPVREALRQLESEGLVEHYPNRGVFVSEVSEEELFAVLLPVRLLVEEYAMRRTSEHLSPELLAQLEEQVVQMERGAIRRDLPAINEADVRFHELTVAASGSYHTIQLWRSVLPRIRVQFYRLAPRHRNLKDIAAEHRALLECLTSGDQRAIEAALREHIVGTSSSLLGPHQEPVQS